MATAAAVIVAKERHLVDAFVRAGATSVASARTLDELGIEDRGLAIRRLRSHAVVREAGEGRYYADVEVWNAVRRTRRRIVLTLLGILALIGILVALVR
jgi:hypothetical protein